MQPGIWKHFKGNRYLVIGVAQHSETGEELVIYRKLYDDFALLARPKAMFLDRIDREEYQGPRFWFVQNA